MKCRRPIRSSVFPYSPPSLDGARLLSATQASDLPGTSLPKYLKMRVLRRDAEPLLTHITRPCPRRLLSPYRQHGADSAHTSSPLPTFFLDMGRMGHASTSTARRCGPHDQGIRCSPILVLEICLLDYFVKVLGRALCHEVRRPYVGAGRRREIRESHFAL